VQQGPALGVWVPESRSQPPSCDFAEGGSEADDWWMALRLFYLIFRQLLGWLGLLAALGDQ
jgi:hypothetical protein